MSEGLFGTSGVRGPVGEAVTAELALAVGRAVATELQLSDADGVPSVTVGRDSRESGEFLAQAVMAGLRECGVDVLEIGLASTPTTARAIDWLDADAGVVVTASHNPAGDNGLKLWTPSGQAYTPDACSAVAQRIQNEEYSLQRTQFGRHERVEAPTDRHLDALLDLLRREGLTGDLDYSVVVDIGNGTGQLTARALTVAGCAVETLNAQPDGTFPGRASEPTAAHCRTLCSFVDAVDADLGVAHDGDADRMRAVADGGSFLSGDTLCALFARHAVEDGDRVAVPVDTSLVVEEVVGEQGGSVTYTPVGDVHIADAATESAVVFGGEPSGAWIWPEETLCPDGPLAAIKLVSLLAGGKTLSTQLASLRSYPLQRESIEVPEPSRVMDLVQETVSARFEEYSTVDGVKVHLEEGWLLIRASGTQPLVRITAEASTEQRTAELAARGRELVTDCLERSGETVDYSQA